MLNRVDYKTETTYISAKTPGSFAECLPKPSTLPLIFFTNVYVFLGTAHVIAERRRDFTANQRSAKTKVVDGKEISKRRKKTRCSRDVSKEANDTISSTGEEGDKIWAGSSNSRRRSSVCEGQPELYGLCAGSAGIPV